MPSHNLGSNASSRIGKGCTDGSPALMWFTCPPSSSDYEDQDPDVMYRNDDFLVDVKILGVPKIPEIGVQEGTECAIDVTFELGTVWKESAGGAGHSIGVSLLLSLASPELLSSGSIFLYQLLFSCSFGEEAREVGNSNFVDGPDFLYCSPSGTSCSEQ